MDEENDTPWLTVREAAARAKSGVKAIYAAVAGGKLKAARVGTALKIHRAWVDAWLTEEAEIVNPDAPGAPIPLRRRSS